MKNDLYTFKKSSFLSLEKDFSIIINLLLNDETLKKLLYYNVEDCLFLPNLTVEQSLEVGKNNIKIIPKLKLGEVLKNYILISFDNFSPNAGNPEYRDNYIIFDVVCDYDFWGLSDIGQLRPYKIAGQIDKLVDNQKLSGIGTTTFTGAGQLLLDDQKGGVTMMYEVIHGNDDKIE